MASLRYCKASAQKYTISSTCLWAQKFNSTCRRLIHCKPLERSSTSSSAKGHCSKAVNGLLEKAWGKVAANSSITCLALVSSMTSPSPPVSNMTCAVSSARKNSIKKHQGPSTFNRRQVTVFTWAKSSKYFFRSISDSTWNLDATCTVTPTAQSCAMLRQGATNIRFSFELEMFHVAAGRKFHQTLVVIQAREC